MKTPILETNRLVLRTFCMKDAEDVFVGWESDPDVARYMFWESHNDINKTIEWVKKEMSKIDSSDWYRWAIISKKNNKLLGTCLIYLEEEYREFEVAYNLTKKAWGYGYTTEAMTEVLNFAQKKLGLKTIMGRCAKENPSSARVMEKLGFKFIRDIPYECDKGEKIYEGKEYKLEL